MQTNEELEVRDEADGVPQWSETTPKQARPYLGLEQVVATVRLTGVNGHASEDTAVVWVSTADGECRVIRRTGHENPRWTECVTESASKAFHVLAEAIEEAAEAGLLPVFG